MSVSRTPNSVISVSELRRSHGERVLFQNLSFGLNQGDKAALVANNGTGKSTLLRIIAGQDHSDGGQVQMRNGLRIGFLQQDPDFASAGSKITIAEMLATAESRVQDLRQRYEAALERASTGNAEDLNLLDNLTSEMEAMHAWDYEFRLEAMLDRLGVRDRSVSVHNLSGGMKKRLALAMVLSEEPDLLLLDEPTNHLDLDMVEWLETYLQRTPASLLMVTHDRYVLDRVCTVIFELDPDRMYRHEGNYSRFLESKTLREEAERIETGKAAQLMKRELEWVRRQPKARTTKSKARMDAFEDLKERASSGRTEPELKLDVKMTRIGGKVLELKKVYKSFGEHHILRGFDYTFRQHERIGIIGRNGTGKSTFLNIITGKVLPDSGKVNPGETIVFGYYTQHGIKLNEDKRVIEVLRDIADVIQLSDGSKISASQMLQHFQFSAEKQHTFVSKLSGGERRRLHLLTVLMKNPNFLILDEPTNDLDLITLRKLEEFLESFPGCLVVVTHDRYFMDRLVDHLFVFEGNGVIHDHWGTYTEWKRKLEEAEEVKSHRLKNETDKKAVPEKASSSDTDIQRKLSFKERHELELLNAEIPQLESEKIAIETRLTAPMEYEGLKQLTDRLTALTEELDTKSLRWLELTERGG